MEQQSRRGSLGRGELPLAYLFFLLMAYLASCALLLVLAVLLYRFQWSRNVVHAGVIAIYVISTFLAGFLAGKKARNRKYLWGFLMGSGYFLILCMITLLLHAGGDWQRFLTTFLLCAGGGAIGGMVS